MRTLEQDTLPWNEDTFPTLYRALSVFPCCKGDEGELAQKVATLRWHGKELELRNRNLIQGIKEEEEEIMQLKVKLKVLPLKQKLNADEWWSITTPVTDCTSLPIIM